MGTKYKSVDIPNSTWMLAIANADVTIRRVIGGSIARSAGLRAEANRRAVHVYVVIA